jgi:hypothetical protein
MSAEQISTHFVRFLGGDVGVSFSDPNDPSEVILYRPDRLSESFVQWAFDALEDAAPDAAAKIDRLLVSYETRLGRTQRGVSLSRKDAPEVSEPCSGAMTPDPITIGSSAQGQDKRFYFATCTICGDHALECFVTTQALEIECGRCGGYGLTVNEKAKLNKLPRRERKAWLDHIRQQAP